MCGKTPGLNGIPSKMVNMISKEFPFVVAIIAINTLGTVDCNLIEKQRK